MKGVIAVLLLVWLSQESLAQKDTLPFTSEKEQAKYNELNARRIKGIAFSNQTLNYSPRSWACPPYFDLGSPKTWYIFSADISPEFIISSGRLPFTIHLVARYMVRIMHDNPEAGDSSYSVRTPSFRPGAILYFPIGYVDDEVRKIKYWSISVFHHSNGQDGNEFNHDGSFNLYDGNFSTNYVTPAFHFRKRKYLTQPVSEEFQNAKPNYKDFYGSAGLELHFRTADSLKSSYGNQRINLELGYISVIKEWDTYHGRRLSNYFYGENYRFIFNFTYIAGDRDKGLSGLDKRINTELSYYWRIKGSPNASLFASTGYYGSDPYNIYYANSYFFFRAGIALGFFITTHLK
jgi:hypothetical protein